MKLEQNCNNKLNVLVGKRYCLAFSYDTLIGIYDKDNMRVWITDEKHSNITCRHKRAFERDYIPNKIKIEFIPQEKLDKMIKL